MNISSIQTPLNFEKNESDHNSYVKIKNNKKILLQKHDIKRLDFSPQ